MKALEAYVIILTTITTIATAILSYYIFDLDNKLKSHITKTQTSIKGLDSLTSYIIKEQLKKHNNNQLKEISLEIEIIKKDINLLYQNTIKKTDNQNLANSYKQFKEYFSNKPQ